MADGGIKQISEEMEQAGESVVKTLKDEVGQIIEQGLQSITGQTSTPQKSQNQQPAQDTKAEDQKKLTETRRKIKWYKDIEEAQRKVREEAKQKEIQRLQQKESKKQDEKMKFFEQKQKKQTILAPTPMSNIENKNKMAA